MNASQSRTKKIENFLLNPDKEIFTSIQELVDALGAIQQMLSGVDLTKLELLQGKDGVTPQKGVDYFTEQELAQIQEFIEEKIPSPTAIQAYINRLIAKGFDALPVKEGPPGPPGESVQGENGKPGEDGRKISATEIAEKLTVQPLDHRQVKGLKKLREDTNSNSEAIYSLEKKIDEIPVYMPPAVTEGGGGGGATDHGALIGLADDDHPQYQLRTEKGTANGYAELDGTGKVPSSQLPSFVDDVIEAANFAALPITGETGKIYVTLDTNITYRWSGSAYTEISASLALGSTPSTAHRGDHGAAAYAHSLATGNPHATTKTDIGLGNVPNVDATARANHTGTQSADTIIDGTTNKAYTATEKTKLAGIATGATANDTDANLKNRANHTGAQLAATISDFASAVIATVLTGFTASATRTAIVATDSVLLAFGKAQKYFNDLSALAFSGSASDLTGTKTSAFISDFNAAAQTAAPAETTTTTGALINTATAKTTPADADQIGLMDSAASNILKKLSWANLKATLKTYFDTLYAPIGGGGGSFIGSRQKQNASTSCGGSTWTNVIFQVENFDTDTMHDLSTNPERITIKTAGKYMIGGTAKLTNADKSGVRILHSGGAVVAQEYFNFSGVSPYEQTFHVSAIFDCAVNDYLTLQAFIVNGGSTSGDELTSFWAHKIG